MKYKQNILFVISLILILLSCTDTTNNDNLNNKVNISGKLNFAKNRAFAEGSIDKICAIPIYNNFLKFWELQTNYDNRIEIDVPVTGDFNIDLSTSEDSETVDWVLLLIDSTQANKEDQVIGYVSMSDVQASLLMIPTSAMESDIDLGDLDQNGTETTSSNTISDNSASFSLSIDELLGLARVDEVFKSIKNIYVNITDTTRYALNLRLMCRMPISCITNQYSNPLDYVLMDYTLDVYNKNFTSTSVDDITNESNILEFIPPETITLNGGEIFDSGNPLTSTSSNFMASWDYEGTYNTGDIRNIKYSWITIQGPSIAAGLWTLKENSVKKAVFDVAVASAIDSNGRFNVFVPSLKVTVNESYKITRIDLKWQQYNSTTDTYEDVPVEIESVLRRFVHNPMIGLRSYSGSVEKYFWYYDEYAFTPSETAYFTENAWYMPGASSGTIVNTIQVGSSGVDFWFENF